MLDAALAAAAQIFSKPFRSVFWKTLLLTLASLALAWAGFERLLASVRLPYAWLETALAVVGGLGLFVGAVTTVWFTWGGVRDLIRLFRSLKTLKRSVLDDGRVIDHVSADDVALVEAVENVRVSAAHEAERKLKDALAAEEKRQRERREGPGSAGDSQP